MSNSTKKVTSMMITAHIHPDAKKIIKNQKVKEYEKNLIKIGSCDNIKDFWNIFQHMKQPKDLSPGIDYQIFKKGIKPFWEDEMNFYGGKFSLLVNKKYSSLIWEEFVFAFAGGIIPHFNEINGIVFSSRYDFDVIQVWFKHYEKYLCRKIRTEIKNFFQIPLRINIEITPFNVNINYNGFGSRISKHYYEI